MNNPQGNSIVFDGKIYQHPFHRAIYDLCQEIEKLPASEQATKCVIAAGELQNRVAELRWLCNGYSACIRQYSATYLPQTINGEKHIARVLMESIAADIDEHFNPKTNAQP